MMNSARGTSCPVRSGLVDGADSEAAAVSEVRDVAEIEAGEQSRLGLPQHQGRSARWRRPDTWPTDTRHRLASIMARSRNVLTSNGSDGGVSA